MILGCKDGVYAFTRLTTIDVTSYSYTVIDYACIWMSGSNWLWKLVNSCNHCND